MESGKGWAKVSMMVLCTNVAIMEFAPGSVVRDNLRDLVPFLKFPQIRTLVNHMCRFIT
jgi:hypothetical protein